MAETISVMHGISFLILHVKGDGSTPALDPNGVLSRLEQEGEERGMCAVVDA